MQPDVHQILHSHIKDCVDSNNNNNGNNNNNNNNNNNFIIIIIIAIIIIINNNNNDNYSNTVTAKYYPITYIKQAVIQTNRPLQNIILFNIIQYCSILFNDILFENMKQNQYQSVLPTCSLIELTTTTFL